jgi:hypothetical protein
MRNAKQVSLGLLASCLLSTSAASFATIDVIAVTAGVTDATTAMTTIIMALMTMAVTLFGIGLVYKYLDKRSPVSVEEVAAQSRVKAASDAWITEVRAQARVKADSDAWIQKVRSKQ